MITVRLVTDTTNVQPGETTVNFTFYCVGERGDHTSHGWFGPFSLMMAIHAVVVVAVVLFFWVAGRVRRATRGRSKSYEPERVSGL